MYCEIAHERCVWHGSMLQLRRCSCTAPETNWRTPQQTGSARAAAQCQRPKTRRWSHRYRRLWRLRRSMTFATGAVDVPGGFCARNPVGSAELPPANGALPSACRLEPEHQVPPLHFAPARWRNRRARIDCRRADRAASLLLHCLSHGVAGLVIGLTVNLDRLHRITVDDY